MVKANFSFGGKLVLVLVTVVVYTFVLIAGAIGGGLAAAAPGISAAVVCGFLAAVFSRSGSKS